MERRRIITLGAIGGAIALSLVLFGRAPQDASGQRVPSDPNEVLETLPWAPASSAQAPDPRRREVAELQKVLAIEPKNLATAVRLARLDIQLARERADPRYLGQAQAVLAPWWNDSAPPVVLVLRATIEQSLHDFESALAHLDLALKTTPADAQAWLTRAVVLTVLARYDEARASCTSFGAHSRDELALTVCETQIDSLLGKARPAYERLDGLLARTSSVTVEEGEWAFSTLGEYAARFGDDAAAEKQFRRALEVAPDDAYVRGALADLLTDLGRFDDAIAITRGHDNDDALLLRLAIAERRAKKKEANDHIEMLAARFDASRARGDVVHRREEARFWLELKDDPARAYELAAANWKVQREPWDARIFLMAARAAKASESPVAEHVKQTGLEGRGISR